MTFKKVAALLLCAMITASSAACGGSREPAPSVSSTEPAVSVSDSAEVTPAPEPDIQAPVKISDNGQPIADFDEFVNGAWKEEQKAGGDDLVYRTDEPREVITERIKDILENTDVSTLSEDDGLYKAIMFYRQVIDDSDKDLRIKTIKGYLSRIEKAKNLNDLYSLYREEQYAITNPVLRFVVGPDDNGYTEIYISPISLKKDLDALSNTLDGGEVTEYDEVFHAYLNDLGYSDARLKEMVENAMTVSEEIEAFRNSPEIDGYTYYYRPKKFENEGVEVPVFEILAELYPQRTEDDFMGEAGVCTLLNNVYKAENAKAIRDHMILRAAMMFSWISGCGFPDTEAIALSCVRTVGVDVLAAEYQKRYISDSVMQEVTALTEDIKNHSVDVVVDNDWFSTHGMELARRKIFRMRENIGSNGAVYMLSNMTVSDNVIDEYISILTGRNNFYKAQLPFEDFERQTFDVDMLDVNARHFPRLNVIVVCTGLVGAYADLGDVSYEEKLGHIGSVIAHEISHSYDPGAIDYESTGYYEPWLTEDEQAEYTKEVQSIADFFDGLEDEYGNKIEGEKVMREAFADILSVKICLRMLSERENADYDAFFRAYASYNALYYTEEGAAAVFDDTHLPGKFRINYVLGQFDEFYDTYDIDENSPYFVPADKRIRLFGR